MKLTICGIRGSYPVFGKEYEKYGGSTSCYLIETSTQAVIVDAGTGIINVPEMKQQNIPILMTHSHVDHLIGLMAFNGLKDAHRNIDIYLAKRDGLSPKKQIERLISNPLWPCKIDDYPAKVSIKELKVAEEKIEFGDIKVFSMDANHPGGSTIFRVESNGKRIVIITDHDHADEVKTEEIAEFSKEADLILYDAQYTEEEYEEHRGYGHSTPEAGIRLKDKAKAKKLVFIHHSPAHNDSFIKAQEERIRESSGSDISFGYEGEVITI
ncbi:metallo-beta-lactamase family protein [Butyrivibrio proteoclasticus B316]|uniref:Metallo-beta-lactamase family protein n=1 Tax=Butyrivibrio proteoclasticus (strain ATCC 51982 / DSM 14932 / B316) TaxID=515622 RepID=E0RVJ9_BUTPB|nr:MBL fold metallo-hydrolase [Butyrivibrio proteoclasticus]ADL34848.1 metallo-beta-lactamase family protein [Butyrivibrio proteoclasticus B316]